MRRFLSAFMTYVSLAVPAGAGQPISESFVECAQLYDMLNRAEPARRGTEKGAMLEYAAAQLMRGAPNEAEGRQGVGAYLDEMATTKAEKWDAKGLGYVMIQDARDWFANCRSLARDRGIALKP